MVPPPETIDSALEIMKAAFTDTLTANAADALIAGDVRASNLLRLDLNFALVSSRAVEATQSYRAMLERYGGSDVTEVGPDGIARRVFKPWLDDAIKSDREEISRIVADAVESGKPLKQVEQALDEVFAMREHNAKLTAYQETKQLFNKGTMDRFNSEGIQRGTWRHMDPQPNPREEHQALDGRVFDIDDPVWNEMDLPNCHCYMEPVIER